MKKYVCGICGYIYDEARGIPDAGITPGTSWEELPDAWVCPWCGAPKSMFKEQAADRNSMGADTADAETAGMDEMDMENKEMNKSGSNAPGEEEDGLRELTAGEMSALCSNLAKGCEKQYLKEEAALFTQLSGYFKDRIPEADEASAASLEALAAKDLNDVFPKAEKAAEAEPDRGALRALVWSKKVTNMVDALLSRYEKEGEGFLEHTNVYVCDICGFIYAGDTPPALCPVCKVPNWKMTKVERR